MNWLARHTTAAGVLASSALMLAQQDTAVAQEGTASAQQDTASAGKADGSTAVARPLDASTHRALMRLREAELAAGGGGDLDALARVEAEAMALVDAAPEARPGASGTGEQERRIVAMRLVQDAASLTRDAIRARAEARTVRAAADAEDELARRRTELARAMTEALPDCARELLLASAEDLLLRRRGIDGSDEMIAVGLATRAEVAAAREVLRQAESRLDDPLLGPARAKTAAIATDPFAMRVRLLRGMAALAASDVARIDGAAMQGPDADARRREAAQLLEEAARTELPVPAVIRSLLDLARARATGDAALRARLLSEQAASTIASVARLARIERWRDAVAGGGDAAATPFPALGTEDRFTEMLAITAQIRAGTRPRDGGGAGDAPRPDAFAPLERALRARLAGGAVDAQAALAAERLAVGVALRLDARLLELAGADGAPPLLSALRLLAPDGGAGSDAPRLPPCTPAQLDRLRPLVADRAYAPWLGVALARALQEGGRVDDATDTLVDFVRAMPAAPKARAAIDIALEGCRARAEREPNGEFALDRALEAATGAFPADPARDGWLCERFDLALFPRWSPADTARAAQLLRLVSGAPDAVLSRAVRALEIEVEVEIELELEVDHDAPTGSVAGAQASASGARARPRDGRRTTELLAQARTLLAQVPAEAPAGGAARDGRDNNGNTGTADNAAGVDDPGTLAIRLLLAEGWLLASSGERAQGLAAIERALATQAGGDTPGARHALRRAAEAWHIVLRLDADAPATTAVPPPALRALSARDPDAARAANDALERHRAAAQSALDAGDTAAARRIAERRLLPLAPLGRGADATRAHILGELLAGNAARAVELADSLASSSPAIASATTDTGAGADASPGTREDRWLLAQALRALGEPRRPDSGRNGVDPAGSNPPRSNPPGSDPRDVDPAQIDPSTAARARTRAFALLRELSPLNAATRDPLWWAAQVAQLEMLADDPTRGADIVARINRLEAMDPALGGARLALRFSALRARAESSMIPAEPTTP